MTPRTLRRKLIANAMAQLEAVGKPCTKHDAITALIHDTAVDIAEGQFESLNVDEYAAQLVHGIKPLTMRDVLVDWMILQENMGDDKEFEDYLIDPLTLDSGCTTDHAAQTR